MAVDPNITGVDWPTPSVTSGPLWATMATSSITAICAHDHTLNKGTRIVTAALNVNADLTFNGWAATSLRMARFNNQSAEPSAGDDLRGLYVYGENLYFINSSGAKVQITNSGTLNASALNANTYVQTSVSTNLTVTAAAAYTQLLVDSSVGPLTITLDPASGFAAGRYFIITDMGAGANPITIAPNAANTINGTSGFTFRLKHGSVQLVRVSTTKWNLTQPLSHIINTATENTGAVLQISASGEAKWGPVDLTDPDAVSGRLGSANLQQATTGAEGAVMLTQDLGGTSTAPTVIALTGASGKIPIRSGCNAIEFNTAAADPTIKVAAAAGAATSLYLQGQDAGGANNSGGITVVAGGNNTGTGEGGKVLVAATYGGAFNHLLSAKAFSATRRVLGLLGDPSTTDAPAGDKIGWLANAVTSPADGAASELPVGGCYFFSEGGYFGWKSPNGNKAVWNHSGGVPTSGSLTAGAGTVSVSAQAAAYVNVKFNGVQYKIPLYV